VLEKLKNIFKTSYEITVVIGSECVERERGEEDEKNVVYCRIYKN
jgi:hypothetical protein